MKTLFMILACSLFLNTVAFGQDDPFNHKVIVQAKADLLRNGFDLKGACGAFRITALVAWRLRPTYGFLVKRGGNRAIVRPDGSCVDGENPGDGYATDYLIDRATGFGYDILSDGGTTNGEGDFSTPETAADMVDRNRKNFGEPFAWDGTGPVVPPAGPTDPPVPPPVDTTLASRVAAIEVFNAIVVEKYNELIDVLNTLRANLTAAEVAIAGLTNRTGALEARPTVSSCTAAANLGAFRIPVSCKLQ